MHVLFHHCRRSLSPTTLKKVTSLKEQEAQAAKSPPTKFSVKQPKGIKGKIQLPADLIRKGLLD